MTNPVAPPHDPGTLQEARTHYDPATATLSQETFLDQDTEQPAWAPGPFRLDPTLTFELTHQWPDPTATGWSSESIFNPSVITDGDDLHVFYRASPRKESLASRIGHAWLRDGIWTDHPQNLILWEVSPGAELGVKDPKIYRTPDGFIMFYNEIFRATPALKKQHPSPGQTILDVGCGISVATSPDLRTWTEHGPITDLAQTRLWAKGAVIPRSADGSATQINGEYLMLVSEGFDGVQHIGRSPDLLHWTFHPQPYLDVRGLSGHLHEVANASLLNDHLVLDFFYEDDHGWKAARAAYDPTKPYEPQHFAPGGTLAWGGLSVSGDRWIFAQGWDAPPGRRQLLFYTSDNS